MEKINLKDAIDGARNIAQNTSPKVTFILERIVKNDRDYLGMCYAYLRWVDDVVDDPNNSIPKKKEFIERQKKIIDSFQNNSEFEPLTKEEYFLFYIIEFALQKNLKKLIESVSLMIDTINWDVMRLEKDGVFSRNQLKSYIHNQLKSTHGFISYFIYKEDINYSKYENFEINNANVQMFMLRDLKEDIDTGLINICREDIQYYNMNIRNLMEDENLSLWIKDQINLIIETLHNEISKIKILPTKLRMLYLFFSIYYLPIVIRYRIYGYYIGSSNKRNFIKEIRTYWQSLFISIKLIRNIL